MVRKGLPKWAITEARRRGAKNIFAYAWTLVKRKGKKRSTKRKRSSNPSRVKKVVRRYTRRRKTRRSGKSLTRTAFKFIRIGALAAPGIHRYATASGDPLAKGAVALQAYGGISADGGFDGALLLRMWSGYLGATLATYGIPKIAGIIRRL